MVRQSTAHVCPTNTTQEPSLSVKAATTPATLALIRPPQTASPATPKTKELSIRCCNVLASQGIMRIRPSMRLAPHATINAPRAQHQQRTATPATAPIGDRLLPVAVVSMGIMMLGPRCARSVSTNALNAPLRHTSALVMGVMLRGPIRAAPKHVPAILANTITE